MASIRGLVRRLGKSAGLSAVPAMDERLTSMERVFQAPPLTPELVSAIRLISPHCDFPPQEKYRRIWEADQNGACWGEYEALAPLFRAMPKPRKILEIGPGMGRSLVFFSKKFGWQGSEIHAYEGEGSSTKYTQLGPRFEDSFCGNTRMLKHVLEFNGIQNVTVFKAQEVRMKELPGPYDLLYSFYSIGFHWSLEHFLDDLLPLMHDASIAVFTLSRSFVPFPGLKGLHYKTIDFKPSWPKDSTLKLLVLVKRELPIP